jgi:hypothetical protein
MTTKPCCRIVVLLTAAAIVAGCSKNDPDAARMSRLLALLTDGEVVSATTAGVSHRVRLTPGPLRPVSGRLIAITPDHRHAAVLAVEDNPRASTIAVLTTQEARITARLRLPADGHATATAVVAPAPDRLVVVGERETAAGGLAPVGWVIELPSGELVARWRIHKPARRNWSPFDAAVDPDSKRLYVSYHGGCNRPGRCTTGVDVVSWETGEMLCRERSGSAGCIPQIHGELAAVDDGILGTSAHDQSILRVDSHGVIAERWPTRLSRNHLMRFASDATNRRIFALGSCLYAGGLARIDSQHGLRWRRGTARARLCGERISAYGGSVIFTEGPEFADESSESEITVVDAATGTVRDRVPTDAPVADLVLLG